MLRTIGRVAAIALALATAGAAVAQQQPAPAIAVPAPEVLLMLVRTTLVALNQANFTGNYTVLHGLGTPGLQAKNSPAQLGIAFTDLRNQGVDMSPALVLTPELTEAPAVSPQGALRLAGFVPSQPLRINFVMVFLPIDNRWRIDGLSVATVQVPQPSAKSAPAAKAPAGADGAKKPDEKKAGRPKAP